MTSTPRRLIQLATTALVATLALGALPAAAAEPVVVETFEAPLPSGSTGSVPLGFFSATDPSSTLTFERTATLPAALPGSAAGNHALKVDATVQSWAVMVNTFTDAAATTWQTKDWSAYEGMQFWMHGTGSGTNLFVDLIDNTQPDSTTDNAERWTAAFADDTAGWRLVQIPFASMTRKDIGNGAPNDGLGLTEVHGWAFGSLATSGAKTFFLDDVAVYGTAPVRPLTVGFEKVDTAVTEGETARIGVTLSKVSDAAVTVTVRSTVATARLGVDVDPVSQTVTIPAGERTAYVEIPTRGDAYYTGDRGVVLELTAVTGAALGRAPVTRLLIRDDERPSPSVIETFETAPYFWDVSKGGSLTQRRVAETHRLARPGQSGSEGILQVTSRKAKTTVTRKFPIEQDWSAGDALTFWYYGAGNGKAVTLTATNPTRSATEGAPETWPMLWSDEFNGPAGTRPDPDRWRYDLGDGTIIGKSGWGNDELQYYTDRRSNAAMDGAGHLVITTRAEPADTDLLCYYGPCRYSSARLLTQDRAEFAYGRLEARVKVPSGAGLWPAFWSLGTNIDTVPWPGSGEIDVMEFVGRDPNRIFGTIHGPGYAGGQSFGRSYDFGKPVSGQFHTYRVDWFKDRIVWAVDGTQYHEAIPANVDPNEWVFNHPFFLLLNVAVGGNFGGAVGADTVFPARTVVDYVRAYQADRAPTSHTATFTDSRRGWQQVTVPLADFSGDFDPTAVLSLSLSAQVHPDKPIYLDDLRLTCAAERTATTTADSGAGSIRDAIATVCDGGTVTLAPALAGTTVELASPLALSKDVTVDGSAAPGVTLSGGGDSRIAEVSAGRTVTLKGLRMTKGYGWELAGAVLNNGTLTLDHVVATGNRVTTGGIDFWKGGGAVYSGDGARLTVLDSTIADNTVEGGAGGGIYSFFRTQTRVERSTISGNAVNDVGGGLRLLGDATLVNTTLSGNRSTGWHGGGLFQTDGALTLTHVTVTGNESPGGTSGGLFVGTFGDSAASMTIASSIVAGNSGEQCFVAPFGAGAVSLTSTGGSVLGDASCRPAATDVTGDPRLTALADHGGPTLTHDLAPGSPAVDLAKDSTTMVDQRGSARPVGPAADAGAVESR